MSKTPTTTPADAADAAAAVEAFEALETGAAWAEPARAANEAIAALMAGARATIFPATLLRVSPTAIATMTFYVEPHMAKTPGYGAALSRLHERALASGDDELGQLLRTREIIARIGVAAGRSVVGNPDKGISIAADRERLAAPARQAYELAIAGQLIAANHALAPAARDLLAAVELAGRVAASQARQEAHGRAELERAELERRRVEAARAVEAGRAAADAQAQAQRLEGEALSARRNARRLRGERFAAKLRASGLDSLHVNGATYGAQEVANLAAADGFSDERLEALEDALSNPRNHKPSERPLRREPRRFL